MPVIGDDLRQFHPDYPRLMREDPLAMPTATAQASGQWIGMSAEYLREQRADVLIETTLRSPEAMASTISSFQDAGYVVELRVVAVPHEVSRLSTVERYTSQIDAVGAGRWTPAAAHDEAYSKAVTTVEDLLATGQVDRFVIEDRTGSVLFDRSYFGVPDGQRRQLGQAAGAAFEEARNIDQLTPDAARSWLGLAQKQIERVNGLEQRNPDLLETIRVIGTVDAQAVAARAYPLDPARAQAVAQALQASISSTSNSTMRASFPSPATHTLAKPRPAPQPCYGRPTGSNRSTGMGFGR